MKAPLTSTGGPASRTAPEENVLMLMEKNNLAMGVYLRQMGAVLESAIQRISELEQKQEPPLTITHRQQKALLAVIRDRADELTVKHKLAQKDKTALRRAMKQELLRLYGIEDLHDLPASCHYEAYEWIKRWSRLALIRKLREQDTRQ